MLQQSVRTYASHRAIVFGDRTLDFAAFGELSDRAAAGLCAQGVHKDDRVGLYCVNSDIFAIAYMGIVKAGATVVPINTLQNPREVAYILKDAGARGLIYHELFSDAVNAIRTDIEDLSLFIRIGETKGPESDMAWTDIAASTAALPDVSFDPVEDVVVIIYTSGTTGHPKGAMLTHQNLISNTCSIKAALQLEPGIDTILVVLPMFHAFAATVGMLFPLLHGCTMVPLPRFDPEQVAHAIAASHATIFMGVPSMFNVLLRLRDEFVPKLSCLKFAVSGGAAMPVEIMQQFEDRFGKLIYEGDGPTECGPVTCVNPIGGQRKLGSVGLSVPGVAMKIMDESGHERPHNQIGEICVKGPNVMKGYWNLPQQTRESFFGDWFRTGDLGTEDPDGYFTIVDRMKDMIIVNGMNVYPRMIENVLCQHPVICEAAVVGESHRLHGEIPVAYVTCEQGQAVSPAALMSLCKAHLGRHEIPRKIIFMEQLPKNATGKILKRQLRRQGELERGIDIERP
ncbi:MAG: long-chain fatty acid--CoA ligase [Phycisphaerae bacterium]|nr:long-chain fatty acid--CoA ligase [Phycisphaerae bacterium]